MAAFPPNNPTLFEIDRPGLTDTPTARKPVIVGPSFVSELRFARGFDVLWTAPKRLNLGFAHPEYELPGGFTRGARRRAVIIGDPVLRQSLTHRGAGDRIGLTWVVILLKESAALDEKKRKSEKSNFKYSLFHKCILATLSIGNPMKTLETKTLEAISARA